ncbi:MAG: thiamine phosphate synthase [Caulobacteraceae bacterium]
MPPLLFFTDPTRVVDAAAAVEALPPGAGVVFRHFGAPDAGARGRRLRAIARRRGIAFFVGADIALAVRLRADGVHLPERAAGRAGAIGALRRRFTVTAAAHSLPAILRARRAGVDAVVISPVFASASPSAGRPLGTLRFAALVRVAGVAAYALGGIAPATAPRLRRSGACGLAAVEGAIGPAPAQIRT